MRQTARALALVTLVAGSMVVGSAPAVAAGSSRAVVNVGGSNTVISFNGSIRGIDALNAAANVAYIQYGGQGVAVCSINGVGNPAVAGQCLGEQSDGRYWSYWRAAPGATGFAYSGQGAGSSSVTDGWVEGWSFGKGTKPPFSSFCAVAGCAPPPTSPPATAAAATGGVAAGSTGGTATTGAGGGVAATGSASTPATASDGTPLTTTPSGKSEDGRRPGNDNEQASAPTNAASQADGDGDGGSGTPVGIALVGVLLAAIVGATQWRKRRRAA